MILSQETAAFGMKLRAANEKKKHKKEETRETNYLKHKNERRVRSKMARKRGKKKGINTRTRDRVSVTTKLRDKFLVAARPFFLSPLSRRVCRLSFFRKLKLIMRGVRQVITGTVSAELGGNTGPALRNCVAADFLPFASCFAIR